jgi:hypothetical protein
MGLIEKTKPNEAKKVTLDDTTNVNLNFEIPLSFRRKFTMITISRDLKMSELIECSFENDLEVVGRK